MKTKLLIPVFALIAGGLSPGAEVDAEAQRLLGIETEDLTAKSLPPEIAVFGSVLPPAPMIDLFRQMDAARDALGLSKESLDRVEKLFATGELVARKDVQAAQAQHALDKTALQGFEDRLALEWGSWFSKMTGPERTKLLEGLLAGRVALIRLSALRGEPLDSAPLAARVHSLGQELSPIRGTALTPAPSIDPAFQSQAFLGLLETPLAPLAVGLMLTGALELKGEPRAGVLVPQSAVVFYLGKAWLYQKEGEGKFERVEVPIDTPVEGGWFVAGDVLEPHPIVTKGAQSLLSKETLAPAAEEE